MARTASARGATRQSSTEPLQNESNGEGTSSGFPLSNKVLGTLDPCVVKTKQWMEDHAHRWEDKEGIFSLAQGVVYWSPPPACRKALVDAVMPMAMASGGESNADGNADDPLALHSYSPAGGLPELVEALKAKIGAEHGMTDHDVTVTVGANQAYTNIVLTLLGDNGGRAVVFCPYYFNHVMAIQMCAGPEAVVTGPTDMSTGRPDLEWLGEALRSDGASASSPWSTRAIPPGWRCRKRTCGRSSTSAGTTGSGWSWTAPTSTFSTLPMAAARPAEAATQNTRPIPCRPSPTIPT